MTPTRRKPLFIAILAGGGVLLALAVAAAMIGTGRLEYSWTRRLRQEKADSEAARRPLRLLVLGDSFLGWWPIEHTLRTDIMGWCAPRGVGTINAAFGGAGPYEYADRMRALAPGFKPGLTILFYFAGNDLTDLMHRASPEPLAPPKDAAGAGWDRWRGGLEIITAQPAALSLPLAMIVGERLLAQASNPAFDWDAMLRNGVDPEIVRMAQNAVANPGKIGPDFVNPYLITLAMQWPDHFQRVLLMEGEGVAEAWVRVQAELRKVRDLARGVGSDLWIVMIPATAQVDASHHDFYRRVGFKMEDRLVGATAAQDAMREFCAREEIPFLDLLPVLRSHPGAASLYWENDDHFDVPGYVASFEPVRTEILDPWWEANKPEVPEPAR